MYIPIPIVDVRYIISSCTDPLLIIKTLLLTQSLFTSRRRSAVGTHNGMAYLGQTGKHWTSGVVPRLSEPPVASTEPPPVYTMLQRLPDPAVGPERRIALAGHQRRAT